MRYTGAQCHVLHEASYFIWSFGILHVSGSSVSQVVSVLHPGHFGWPLCVPSIFINNIINWKLRELSVKCSRLIFMSEKITHWLSFVSSIQGFSPHFNTVHFCLHRWLCFHWALFDIVMGLSSEYSTSMWPLVGNWLQLWNCGCPLFLVSVDVCFVQA